MENQNYARPDLLVETEWLSSRLNSPNIRIIDCDPYDVYRRAHIENAVGIRAHHYIKHPKYSADPTSYPLVAPPESFIELMESMGIDVHTLVVAYDSMGGLWATRLWWVLNYYGHTNVVVLNGGWKKWFDEGRPISQDPPEIPKIIFPLGRIRQNPSLACTRDYGVGQVGSSTTIFLDVRSQAEWDGINDRGNRRSGHIPGAVHLEWLNFVTDDRHRTFKPAHELRAMLEERGVMPDKQIITY